MESQLMPSKIRPKYGTDPVQEVRSFSFEQADKEHLINLLAPIKAKPDEIIARLQECARGYLWRRNQNQKVPTRAEQNAALKEVGDFAREHGEGLCGLEMRLRNVDLGTEWELDVKLRTCRIHLLTEEIADLADRLGELADAAEQALRAGKQKSGPRMRMHVQTAVRDLVNLYEECTGKPFSHNPKVLTKYDGKPHSRAGGFIVASQCTSYLAFDRYGEDCVQPRATDCGHQLNLSPLPRGGNYLIAIPGSGAKLHQLRRADNWVTIGSAT
jgi:hypothetical protein